jgi:hypothetical protein
MSSLKKIAMIAAKKAAIETYRSIMKMAERARDEAGLLQYTAEELGQMRPKGETMQIGNPIGYGYIGTEKWNVYGAPLNKDNVALLYKAM